MFLLRRPLTDLQADEHLTLPINYSGIVDHHYEFDPSRPVNLVQLREPLPRDLRVPLLPFSDDDL